MRGQPKRRPGKGAAGGFGEAAGANGDEHGEEAGGALTWATTRPAGEWAKVFNLRGLPFFRHTHTGETQWEIPENDVGARLQCTWDMALVSDGDGGGAQHPGSGGRGRASSGARLCFYNRATGAAGSGVSAMTLGDQGGVAQASAAAFAADMAAASQQVVAPPLRWRHDSAAEDVSSGTSSDENVERVTGGGDGEFRSSTDEGGSAVDGSSDGGGGSISGQDSPSRARQLARGASEFLTKSASKVEQSFSGFVQLAKRWGHAMQEANKSYETAVRVSTALGPGLAFKPRQTGGNGTYGSSGGGNAKQKLGIPQRRARGGGVATTAAAAAAEAEAAATAAARKWTVYLEDGRRVDLAFGDLKFGAGLDHTRRDGGSGGGGGSSSGSGGSGGDVGDAAVSMAEAAAAAASSGLTSSPASCSSNNSRSRSSSSSSGGGGRLGNPTTRPWGLQRRPHHHAPAAGGSRVRVQTPFGAGVILRRHGAGGLYDVLIDAKGTVSIPKSQLVFGGGEELDATTLQQLQLQQQQPQRRRRHGSSSGGGGGGGGGFLGKIVRSLDTVLDPIAQRSLDGEGFRSDEASSVASSSEDEDANGGVGGASPHGGGVGSNSRHASSRPGRPQVPSLNLTRVVPTVAMHEDRFGGVPMPQNARR